MIVISRQQAKDAGLKHYFTGKACGNGHVNERQVSNATCLLCIRMRQNTDTEKAKRLTRQRRSRATPEGAASHREHNHAYLARPGKMEKHLKNCSIYQATKGRECHLRATRNNRMKRRKRAVVWAEWEKIDMFYAERDRLTRETGIEHEVDHVIPLNGKLVCGLHVHQNLNVIPSKDNIRKSNRFERI